MFHSHLSFFPSPPLTLACVDSMYSPWVCNVVGAKNHKFFVLFVFYTMLCCIMSILLVGIRFVRCGFVHDDDDDSSGDEASNSKEETQWTTGGTGIENAEDSDRKLQDHFIYQGCEGLYGNAFVIGLLFVAVAFMIFTCVMLCEQLEAIESNTGKIARMKLRIGQGGTELERVTQECNEMFGGKGTEPTWHWFLPLPVQFPDGLEKAILGYDWDPTFGDEPYQEDDMVAALHRGVGGGNEAPAVAASLDALEAGTAVDKTVEEEIAATTATMKKPPPTDESFVTTAKKRSRKSEDNAVFVAGTKERFT